MNRITEFSNSISEDDLDERGEMEVRCNISISDVPLVWTSKLSDALRTRQVLRNQSTQSRLDSNSNNPDNDQEG
jgi:hypothetical protein